MIGLLWAGAPLKAGIGADFPKCPGKTRVGARKSFQAEGSEGEGLEVGWDYTDEETEAGRVEVTCCDPVARRQGLNVLT